MCSRNSVLNTQSASPFPDNSLRHVTTRRITWYHIIFFQRLCNLQAHNDLFCIWNVFLHLTHTATAYGITSICSDQTLVTPRLCVTKPCSLVEIMCYNSNKLSSVNKLYAYQFWSHEWAIILFSISCLFGEYWYFHADMWSVVYHLEKSV